MRAKPSRERRQRRPTFSNAISLVALFVALGGSAYATGLLPPNSVGTSQLKPDAVTQGKLGRNSVGRSELKANSVTATKLNVGSVTWRALNRDLRLRLIQKSRSGATGVQASPGSQGLPGSAGPTGPAGSQGSSGPGAVRMHLAAAASTTPSTHTLVDAGGLQLAVACQDNSPGTELNISETSADAASILENINVDNGPPAFAEAHSANLHASLPPGTSSLGGPSVGSGEFVRIFARILYVSPRATVELTLAIELDGSAKTCSLDGVAVPALS